MTAQPQIEPVTDEDVEVAYDTHLKACPLPCWVSILEQDRRRVAERRVGRQSDYNPTSPSHEAANAELARIASVIDDAREIERLRAENTHLRTLVAVQATPCVYCGLTEMAKCTRGFPGCARADDLICGEEEAFKAVVSERNTLRAEVAAHRKHDVLRCDALMKAEAEVAKLNEERADCEPFLKEGERLDECIERWRADASAALGLLVQEKKKSEALEAEVARLTAALNGKENSDA